MCILFILKIIINYESEKNSRTAVLTSIWKLLLRYQIQMFIYCTNS